MALAPHTRLGSFEILELVGVGGMGEVYRARDLRLDRIVAVKVLPPEFAHRADRRARFEREARAVASLNHPHICVLHDVGHQDGTDFLVLEFLEGETLAQLLQKGPLPIHRTIELAIQMALSLEAAHKAGVVHRDLKPGNVVLTKDGLKLVDFGLARVFESRATPGAHETTISQRATSPGQFVGTVQYMAPEQFEGHEGDERSDIFSFGCVLYEMLTGTAAFTGSSTAGIIAAILTIEPVGLADSDTAIPPFLRRILNACLARNPGERFQSARDLRRALEWTREEQPAVAPKRGRWTAWIAAACAACMLILAVLLFTTARPTQAPPHPAPVRFLISAPPGALLQEYITQQAIAVAPSGGRVAMIANDAGGRRVFVRRLDSLEPVALAGTEGALTVFWSADSKDIGFFANGKVWRIPAQGGTAVPICSLPILWSASWSPQGDIIANLGRQTALRIRADTGEVSPWRPARWPHFLPDGRQVIYVQPENGTAYVFLADYPSGHTTRLMRTDTQAVYVPASDGSGSGYVLFGISSTLLAQRLNPQTGKLDGEPVAVAEGVPFFQPSSWSQFDASPDGNLLFGTGVPLARLVLMDRSGKEVPLPAEERPYFSGARFDPSFTRLVTDVYDLTQGKTALWQIDLHTGAGQRITFSPDLEAGPVWSPNGRKLAFGNASRTAAPQLRVLTLNNAGAPASYPPGSFQMPMDWSPDGRWIAYQTTGGDQAGDIWFASAGDDHKIYPILSQDPFQHTRPAFSPDGKYLAYSANESGRLEIYVQAIDARIPPRLTGERYRVSLNGGTTPRWSHDQRELFFLSLQQEMMAVPFNPRGSTMFGTPVRLFALPASVNTMNPSGVVFDVDQSGTHFLVTLRDTLAGNLQVALNWQAFLKSADSLRR